MFFLGKRIKIGTRGSKLALWQANFVKNKLKSFGINSEIVVIKTKGDLIKDKPLYSFGGKGLFIMEIENQLIKRNIDIAVHSLKDMSVFDNGVFDSVFLKRDTHKDVLISHKGNLFDLPKGAAIGTTSLRRRSEIYKKREDLEFTDLRGNLDTRLKKLEDSQVDAVVVSKAGLLRLGLFDERYMFDLDIISSAGQGIIAVEFLKDFEFKKHIYEQEDEQTRDCAQAERAYVKALNASCNYPIGAYAYRKNGRFCMDVMYGFINDITRNLHYNLCAENSQEAIDKAVAYIKNKL